jgi:hypothetical protein
MPHDDDDHKFVAMAIPISEIRKIVSDLDSVAFQLGPNAQEFYNRMSEGLAEWDESGGRPMTADYEIPG